MFAVRPRRRVRRCVGFESLEGRLALASGLSAAALSPAALVGSASTSRVNGALRGSIQLMKNSNTVMFTNMRGTLDGSSLSGSGRGFILMSQFRFALLEFQGREGSVSLVLGQAPIRQSGASGVITVPFTVRNGSTGKFAKLDGGTGTIEIRLKDHRAWTQNVKQEMTARFTVQPKTIAPTPIKPPGGFIRR